ncbi:hypothetical protein F4782DRAFT_521308 [Xylaria castorea]|nr:hypothetical protein F4782DRAFT_521308 [Xylaria castorea]
MYALLSHLLSSRSLSIYTLSTPLFSYFFLLTSQRYFIYSVVLYFVSVLPHILPCHSFKFNTIFVTSRRIIAGYASCCIGRHIHLAIDQFIKIAWSSCPEHEDTLTIASLQELLYPSRKTTSSLV